MLVAVIPVQAQSQAKAVGKVVPFHAPDENRLPVGQSARPQDIEPAGVERPALIELGRARRRAKRLSKSCSEGGVGPAQLGDSAACIPEFRLVVSMAEADHAQGRDAARRLGSNHGDHSAPEPRRVGLEPSPRREKRAGLRRE